MGCFSVTCGLTGLPIIEGEEVVLFPLVPQEYAPDLKNEKQTGSIVSNSGAWTLFRSLTLPIFGRYDSYGSIEEIIIDENTELIEKFFGIDIRQFVETVTGRAKENPITSKVCGMFMLKEAYDAFIKFAFEDDQGIHIPLGFKYVLHLLGFEFVREEKSRYNQVYKHSKVAYLIVNSDGVHAKTMYKGKSIVAYTPKNLQEALAEHKIEFPYNGIDKMTAYEIYFDMLGQRIVEVENNSDNLDHVTQELELQRALREYDLLSLGAQVRRGEDLMIYLNALRNGSKAIRKAFSDFMIIVEAMYACNAMFMPYISGAQGGSFLSHKLRGEIITKIAQRELD